MSKKGWAVGVVAFLAIVGACNNSEQPSTTSPSAASAPAVSVPAPANATGPSPYSAPVTAGAAARPAGVAVSKVIDGDTFEIAGGQRVRVLGIDSCEMGTYGGAQAKDAAELWLDGQDVVLTEEPGVDRDRAGRLLRYVATRSGTDFGELMVIYPHTGVYQGRNDASAARLADLRETDSGGRDCTEPDYTPSTSSGGSDVDVDLGGDGDNGLPDGALTGGYCARKWWC